jgi:hypothetical protein
MKMLNKSRMDAWIRWMFDEIAGIRVCDKWRLSLQKKKQLSFGKGGAFGRYFSIFSVLRNLCINKQVYCQQIEFVQSYTFRLLFMDKCSLLLVGVFMDKRSLLVVGVFMYISCTDDMQQVLRFCRCYIRHKYPQKIETLEKWYFKEYVF